MEVDERVAAEALRWFEGLGHKVVDEPEEVEGRPEWLCDRCASVLILKPTGQWSSSSGDTRCPHEGADW